MTRRDAHSGEPDLDSRTREELRERARVLLRRRSLRVTQPRVAVLAHLLTADAPTSCADVHRGLRDDGQDLGTVYRNLRVLTAAGLLQVVRVDGVAHYLMFAGGAHRHPHFVCDTCGRICCLPTLRTAGVSELDARWRAAVRGASVQLHGACPECVTMD